jgi:hypothetical protein
MRISQALEIQKAGEAIDVKVTIGEVGGDLVVRFRDYEFSNAVVAAHHIHHIRSTEIPQNMTYMVV